MRLHHTALLVFLFPCLMPQAYAQDSTLYSKLENLPDRLFGRINKSTEDLEHKLDRQTVRYLTRLARQERRIQQKLWKKDSTAAKALFGDVAARYSKLQHSTANSPNVYSAHLDSMQTAMRFMQPGGSVTPAYQSLLNNYIQLQGKLNQTAEISKYLKERHHYLKEQLERFGLTKELRKFQKEIYYYRAQVNEYKRLLDDPSKLEAKLLQLANKIPAFKDFFSKNSMLAAMFRLPGSESVASTAPIPGLQTRTSFQQDILQRFRTGSDLSRAMQQNIHSAQAQINQLKDKIEKLGGSSSDADLPDFKPNQQRVKSLWQRLELGGNIQSTRGSSYFPVTSDVALSAGYKLNDRSVIGIGLSYKLGWGQNIRHIKFTHEGIGLRSFVDVQLKGSIYASGGFEYNYQKPFASIRQINEISHWQQSGLIGVSKIISVKSKVFKKAKLQLLWDALSYRQLPRSAPFKFRVGYQFQ